MDEEKVLFIGGHSDGEKPLMKWNYPWVRKPVLAEVPSVPLDLKETPILSPELEVDEYREVRFTNGTSVALHSELHPDKVLEYLIAGYMPYNERKIEECNKKYREIQSYVSWYRGIANTCWKALEIIRNIEDPSDEAQEIKGSLLYRVNDIEDMIRRFK